MFTQYSRSKKKHSGFTLMELLVSFLIIRVVSVVVHLGFRIGINSRESAENSLQQVRTTEAMLDLIHRQVGSMVPYTSRQEYQGNPAEVLLFQGDPQLMRFVSTFSSRSRSAGGLYLVEYFISKLAKGQTLELREQPLPQDEELLGSIILGVSRTDDNLFVAQFGAFNPRSTSRKSYSQSIKLLENLAEIEFIYLQRQEEKHDAVGLNVGGGISYMPGAAGLLALAESLASTEQWREKLPAGFQMRLKWKSQPPLGTHNFSVWVPIQVG